MILSESCCEIINHNEGGMKVLSDSGGAHGPAQPCPVVSANQIARFHEFSYIMNHLIILSESYKTMKGIQWPIRGTNNFKKSEKIKKILIPKYHENL